MRLTTSGDLTLGGTISSSTITAINTQISNLINGPQTFRGVSTRENGALYLDWNNVNCALDFDGRIQSTGESSTQNGKGILTFSNLRTVFNSKITCPIITSPTITTINTNILNLQTSKLNIINYIVQTCESLGIDQTNNTSDLAKPICNLTQVALTNLQTQIDAKPNVVGCIVSSYSNIVISSNATKILGINNILVDTFTVSKYYKTSIKINTPTSLFRKFRNVNENSSIFNRIYDTVQVILF
jgi:hypothetical protein